MNFQEAMKHELLVKTEAFVLKNSRKSCENLIIEFLSLEEPHETRFIDHNSFMKFSCFFEMEATTSEMHLIPPVCSDVLQCFGMDSMSAHKQGVNLKKENEAAKIPQYVISREKLFFSSTSNYFANSRSLC